MPVTTNPRLDPGFWPKPEQMPCFGTDIVAANAARKKDAAWRDAVYKGMIPPTTYMQADTGRRVYRQVDLRRLFGLPLEGELRLDGPLW